MSSAASTPSGVSTSPSASVCRLGSFDALAGDGLARGWERLPPWPDAVPGLTRLGRRFTVATLSNGNRAQQAARVRHAGLPFDRMLSAEDFRHYKPDPEVYLGAV